MYQHTRNYVYSGLPLAEAHRVMIMIHGRGANPQSILSLTRHLEFRDAAFVAPEASHNSWYPYSFLAPVEENQPALDSALETIHELVTDLKTRGFSTENICFLGFSQGACLTLEYVTRHAQRYGGIIAFTGGLIGEHLQLSNYQGDFANTQVLITTGDPDPHVPVSRVEETVRIMEKMHAKVTMKIYKGRPHTILGEELELANGVFSMSS